MLESIKGPADIKALDRAQLDKLSEEIRQFLIEKVSKTGGPLGPNLGVVELTLAIHRTFDSPRDVVLFDTGHQSYVHKIITGRADSFDGLRQRGGIAGYPNRSESEHDVIENSHASTALSWGDGISYGFSRTGQSDRHVVVVVGDGALTGGMSWEALNNIAATEERNLVIVVNDNERSYSPTIGGLATYLSTLRVTRGYERFLDWGKEFLHKTPVVGTPIYETLHGMKKGIKDIVAPQGMFEDLGLKYMGPIDGHDIAALEKALAKAKEFGAPVLVHVQDVPGQQHPDAGRAAPQGATAGAGYPRHVCWSEGSAFRRRLDGHHRHHCAGTWTWPEQNLEGQRREDAGRGCGRYRSRHDTYPDARPAQHHHACQRGRPCVPVQHHPRHWHRTGWCRRGS